MRAIAEQAQADGLWIHWGRKVLELRPPVELNRAAACAACSRGAISRPASTSATT